MTSPRLRRSAACVALLAFAAAPALAQKRDITEKDLLQFVWVADPQISPDGSQVAFVRVAVDEKKDQYDTGLWIARTDGAEAPRQLTGGTRDTGPRWSPDGRWVAFVRVGREGRPAAVASNPRARDRRRRSPGHHRHAARRRQPAVVARRPHHRVLLERPSRRAGEGRRNERGERPAARERRAGGDQRRLPRQRRRRLRLRRSRSAVAHLDGGGGRDVHAAGTAQAGHVG